jgi:hypothetical protein
VLIEEFFVPLQPINNNIMNKTKRLLISMLTLLCCCTGMWAESSSDVLNGVFTINNSGTRVQFSKGNLQYVNSTYQFAEHQYDYFGNNQDWFSYNNYSAPSDGISWYVMSQAEWEYLFVSRTVTNTLSEGARYSKATIGGTYKGVIVFPDNYTHPDGTDFTGNCENATEAYSSTVSLEGWALMEAAGCVFLPAAGYSTNSGQINKAAIYQSTTRADGSYNYTPGFYSDRMAMGDTSYTSTGVSVRFVKKYLTYHLIGSAQELKDFATLVNSGTTSANAKLTTDIDLAGDDANQWTPIGTDANRYSGTFDGQGFTIKNLYYNQQVEGVGLFGFANTDAYIKNVRVEGMIDNYTGNSGAQTGAGGIIGISDGATVLNCSFSGSVISYSNVGGIVGYGTATIVNCYNEGTVTFHSTSNQAGGGVHGYGGSPQLKNCYTVGSVINNGSSTYAIGSLSYSGTVSNCYSRSGCVQNGGGASWSNAGKYGTVMSLDDMKTATFVTTLNTNVTSLRATYPDICEWVQDPVTNLPMLIIFASLKQDEDGYYLLGSVQDWKDFATLVNTTPTLNARMTADIDLGNDQTRIGSTSDSNTALHYKGIFDGQGHKLTIAFVETGGSNLCAPFNKLDGATVKNLHIKGTIHTAGIHGAGVASDARGTTTIENVWSEVNVTSTHSGWDECSGIVGCMKAGSLTISDCLFSGSVTASSIYNGGFIGYKDNGSASIVNSLSTGTFNYSGSSLDFARGASVSNSYYTQFVGSTTGMTLATAEQIANGTISINLQNGREEEIWVQDVLTNQPQLAIFANKYTVPSSGIGTFSAKAKFAVPEGLTAYYCKTYDSANGTISVVAIDGAVPANTGVVLRGTPGETYTLTGTNSDAATITGNALVAVTEETHIDQTSGDYVNFGLSGGVFKKVNAAGGTVKANRAYLQIPAASLTATANSIAMMWDDEVTAIEEIPMEADDKTSVSCVWYDITGRRLADKPMARGLYIVNGKKVLIK